MPELKLMNESEPETIEQKKAAFVAVALAALSIGVVEGVQSLNSNEALYGETMPLDIVAGDYEQATHIIGEGWVQCVQREVDTPKDGKQLQAVCSFPAKIKNEKGEDVDSTESRELNLVDSKDLSLIFNKNASGYQWQSCAVNFDRKDPHGSPVVDATCQYSKPIKISVDNTFPDGCRLVCKQLDDASE